jgi:predicted phage terminase large subunit-like protein
MVLMPPGHAKSTYVSQVFLPWWFIHHPMSSVIAASNTSDLAQSFGRKVRNLVQREREVLGFQLQEDSKSAGRWETSNGGEYYAAGINGGNGTTITGRRADLAIIDDPVGSREQAQNESTQRKIVEWYRSEVYTRLKSGGRVIVVMTRWDERDLGGQLLDEAGAGGDDWTLLQLPAIAEDPALSTPDHPIPQDPLGRAPGEALWPEEYDEVALHRKRLNVGELDWAALYQQHPKPPKGVLFDVDRIETIKSAPTGKNVVRSWDLAATKQLGSNDPDWTVGLKLLRTVDDRYVVTDVTRERGAPQRVEELLRETADADGFGCPIRLPEDPGQAGKSQSAYYATKLTGYGLTFDRETGAKETRATPVASQVNVGNLSIVEGRWNRAFLAELRDFPNGRKDDQVDALSGAFKIVGLQAPPIRIAPEVMARLASRGIR